MDLLRFGKELFFNLYTQKYLKYESYKIIYALKCCDVNAFMAPQLH